MPEAMNDRVQVQPGHALFGNYPTLTLFSRPKGVRNCSRLQLTQGESDHESEKLVDS